MTFEAFPASETTRRILEREHAAARREREDRKRARGTGGGRPRRQAPADFRTSERHRTSYLSIGADQGRFLFMTAVATGARHIVEFGSSFGISTLYLAAAAEVTGGRVTGSEYHGPKAEKARASLREAGLDAFAEIRVGDARETFGDLASGIDLLFLDGAKDLYLEILLMLEPKLSERALVVADNVAGMDDDDPFLRHIAGPGYTTTMPVFAKGAFSYSLRLARQGA